MADRGSCPRTTGCSWWPPGCPPARPRPHGLTPAACGTWRVPGRRLPAPHSRRRNQARQNSLPSMSPDGRLLAVLRRGRESPARIGSGRGEGVLLRAARRARPPGAAGAAGDFLVADRDRGGGRTLAACAAHRSEAGPRLPAGVLVVVPVERVTVARGSVVLAGARGAACGLPGGSAGHHATAPARECAPGNVYPGSGSPITTARSASRRARCCSRSSNSRCMASSSANQALRST